jgi:hypothetical protein
VSQETGEVVVAEEEEIEEVVVATTLNNNSNTMMPAPEVEATTNSSSSRSSINRETTRATRVAVVVAGFKEVGVNKEQTATARSAMAEAEEEVVEALDAAEARTASSQVSYLAAQCLSIQLEFLIFSLIFCYL